MPLHQLCASSGSTKTSALSSSSPFIAPQVHSQEIHDVKWQRPMERCASQASTLSFSKDICRICHCEGDDDTPLIAPCYCSGSLRYVHQACLQQWIKSSDTKCCELCKFAFIMHSKLKPFSKWERLDMTGIERRKILCSVTFHAIAITCVVWSLYVLIQRTSQEVQNGELEWPFWTKLIVVAIGFTGSIVFMYVQCKMYIHLCRRWRAFNRMIYVQNVPEKIPVPDAEKTKTKQESARLPSSANDAEKPFMGVAVIASPGSHSHLLSGVPPTTVLNSNTATSGGGCCTTSSSPPGALWVDEPSSPQLSNYSYYSAGVPHRKRGTIEMETLITSSEAVTSPRAVRGVGGVVGGESKKTTKNIKSFSDSTHSSKSRIRREEEAELARSILDPRIVRTTNDSFRSHSDAGSDTSDVETLHLDVK